MSYYHPQMQGILRVHHESMAHRLVADPVELPASGTVPALSFHGGPTIRAPKLVALYCTPFWGDRVKNDRFLKELMEYGYLTAFRGQGTDNGQFVGGFDIPAPASGVVTDDDCRRMIQAAIGTNGMPPPDADTLYMLLLPDGVKSVFTAGGGDSSCQSYCAYHSNTSTFCYTVQPANTCSGCNQGNPQDGLQMTEAHEVTEACTDPEGTGWYNDQTGQEGSDETAWIPLQYGPWTVQGAAGQDAQGRWVNAMGSYQQPQPGGGGGQAWQPDPVLQRLYAWQQQATAYIAAQYGLNSAAGAAQALRWQQALTETTIQFFPYVHGRSSLRSVDDMVRLPGVPR